MTLSRRQIALKNATRDDLHSFGGQVAFAEHPGSRARRQQYYSERCAASTDKFLSLDDVAELVRQLRGDEQPSAILTQLCADAGGMFVPLPDVHAHDGPIAEGMGRLGHEFGEAMGAMGETLADGQVRGHEARRCRDELDDMINAAMRLRAQFKAIIRDAKGEKS